MTEIERPLYTVFQYADTGVYKVVKFKRSDGNGMFHKKEEKEVISNEQKLQNNLARAKSTVLQLALCNKWSHFFTFTLDKEKYNRYDLGKFKTDLSQWIRDERKKHKKEIKYLYVPEQHNDGAWHCHGLLGNVPTDFLSFFDPSQHPIKLVNAGYQYIPDYLRKFGFNSVGKIENPIACAFYISKYISKELLNSSLELGVHTYYASKGLNTAVPILDVYVPDNTLDCAIRYKGDFCSVGIVQKKPWHYAGENAEYRDFEELEVNQYIEKIISEGKENNENKKIIFRDDIYDMPDSIFDNSIIGG